MNIEAELGSAHYVILAIMITGGIIALVVAAILRWILYEFVDHSFSLIDETTKLCGGVGVIVGIVFFVFCIGKIFLEKERY